MRRLHRSGFFQRHVYTILGYYPWECPICRETEYIRVRGTQERRREELPAEPIGDAVNFAETPWEARVSKAEQAGMKHPEAGVKSNI